MPVAAVTRAARSGEPRDRGRSRARRAAHRADRPGRQAGGWPAGPGGRIGRPRGVAAARCRRPDAARALHVLAPLHGRPAARALPALAGAPARRVGQEQGAEPRVVVPVVSSVDEAGDGLVPDGLCNGCTGGRDPSRAAACRARRIAAPQAPPPRQTRTSPRPQRR